MPCAKVLGKYEQICLSKHHTDLFINNTAIHSRALTEGRHGDLLGQRGPGGLLHHSPLPVPATANDRPPTAASGPSNDISDATDTADGTEGGRGEREGIGRGGGAEEEEPNCPVQ